MPPRSAAVAVVERARADIRGLYELSDAELMSGLKFFSQDSVGAIGHRVRQKMREGTHGRKSGYTIVFTGMSDVAGHGNLHSESYPAVVEDCLRPVFAALEIPLTVRNMALGGGSTSYPSSICMGDVWGDDIDLLVWDFRMVGGKPEFDELFVRQAMLLPSAPAVLFRRQRTELRALKYAFGPPTALHVLEEVATYEALVKRNASAVVEDTFCHGNCTCPGKTRWHSRWKRHRFNGLLIAHHVLSEIWGALQLNQTRLTGHAAAAAAMASSPARIRSRTCRGTCDTAETSVSSCVVAGPSQGTRRGIPSGSRCPLR